MALFVYDTLAPRKDHGISFHTGRVVVVFTTTAVMECGMCRGCRKTRMGLWPGKLGMRCWYGKT